MPRALATNAWGMWRPSTFADPVDPAGFVEFQQTALRQAGTARVLRFGRRREYEGKARVWKGAPSLFSRLTVPR